MVNRVRTRSKVFISYRRSDASGYAGRLFDHLSKLLGRDRVFMDVDTIAAGDDFVATLEDAVASCDVFLAVIGPSWTSVANADGERRIDDEEDFVRREVQAALDRDVRLIPVLVGGAAMPDERQLPPALKDLARRNALQLSDTRWEYDVGQVVGSILGTCGREAGIGRRVLQGAAAAIVIAVLAAVGLMISGERSSSSTNAERAASRRLAVLPFENLGDPDDDYFAAGMTEELRSRLAAVHDLTIISGQSAAQYAGHSKTVAEIGAELGVQYIVTGSFRWARDADGTSRTRFNPGLVEVASEAELWSEVIDARIEDVFETQSRIAAKVVRQLGTTLFADDAPGAAASPLTADLNAYQHYLRGVYLSRPTDWSRESLDAAVASFEGAVERDPDFVEAWAGLSRAQSAIHVLGFDTGAARCQAAFEALDRARGVGDDHKATALAAGYYQYWCERDYGAALAELESRQLDLRNDDELLSLLSHLQRRQGRWEESLENRRLAADLDPKNLSYLRNIATTLTYMRRYPEAVATCDRLSAIQPDQQAAYAIKANDLMLWQGREGLAAARAALDHAPDALLEWWRLLVFEGDACGAVERVVESDRTWLRVGADAYPREYLLGRAQELCGDPEAAVSYRAAADAVRAEMTRIGDEDFRLLSILARTLARLGEADAALSAAKRSVELLPAERDSLWGTTLLVNLAEVCVTVGETDEALAIVEQLLAQPAWLSVEWLELDSSWEPLRTHPRYAELAKRFR